MAVTITVDTSDVDRVLGNLDGMDLKKPMKRSLALLQSGMATYPPPPSGSTYRRTGTLGRSWTSEVKGGGQDIEGTLGNNVSYGPYVQDDERQARHMAHWQTDEQVASESESQVVGFFDAYIQDLAE